MPVLNIAKQRYSVRKYKNTPVEEGKLQQILEAGRVAPTAANYQPQRMLVIRSEEAMAQLAKATNQHHGAPMAILICSERGKAWKRPFDGKEMDDIDTSIAATHMMLAATELGLGTCWVTYYDPQALKKYVEVPEGWEPISLLTIGYSDESPQSPDRLATTRKPLTELMREI